MQFTHSFEVIVLLNEIFLDAKKKKEQKQMEKEMQRLHLLSGKGAESK